MGLAALQLHGADARHELTLTIPTGQLTLLSGARDSGHELLWRLLGLLEAPEHGEIALDGKSTAALTEPARALLRTRQFGYVFADPFLLPGFSLVENLAMPLFKILHLSLAETKSRVEHWLDFVGLTAAADMPAGELAPEAQQRAALARALVHEPPFLLVEKLDAHLSPAAQLHFMSLLQRVRAHVGCTIIVSAASRALAAFTDRVIELESGRISYDSQVIIP